MFHRIYSDNSISYTIEIFINICINYIFYEPLKFGQRTTFGTRAIIGTPSLLRYGNYRFRNNIIFIVVIKLIRRILTWTRVRRHRARIWIWFWLARTQCWSSRCWLWNGAAGLGADRTIGAAIGNICLCWTLQVLWRDGAKSTLWPYRASRWLPL